MGIVRRTMRQITEKVHWRNVREMTEKLVHWEEWREWEIDDKQEAGVSSGETIRARNFYFLIKWNRNFIVFFFFSFVSSSHRYQVSKCQPSRRFLCFLLTFTRRSSVILVFSYHSPHQSVIVFQSLSPIFLSHILALSLTVNHVKRTSRQEAGNT